MRISVAIDGPAGAGKSTIAKLVSKEFNLMYINTGAMYRAVSLMAKENNIEPSDIKRLMELIDTLEMHFETDDLILNGKNVQEKITMPPFKFFLTATAEERAKRRFNELVSRGIEVNYDTLLSDIIKRDYIDSNREVDPLRMADDAIEIDSSNLSIEEVTEFICNYIKNKLQ